MNIELALDVAAVPLCDDLDPAVRRRAALTVCDRVPREHVRDTLGMLGLLDVARAVKP